MLALGALERMELLGKYKYALAFFQFIPVVPHAYRHTSPENNDQLKGMMYVHRKREIFALFLMKIFGQPEMLGLIKHVFLPK